MTFGKCIVCGSDAGGALVEDTLMIRTIRAAKQKAGIAKNNTLIVCPNCTEAHAKRRRNFERKWATHLVMGVGLVLLIVGLPFILGGTFSPAGIIFAPLIAIFIALLALFDYAPPLAAGAAPATYAGVGKESAPAQPHWAENEKASHATAGATAQPRRAQQKHAQKHKSKKR